MHPLSIETFDPSILLNIDDKLFDTKELMMQVYLNLITAKVDNAKELFNDDDFINKIRFRNTSDILSLDNTSEDIWNCRPNIPDNKLLFFKIPYITHIHGVYVCKTKFSGRITLEHFIILKGVFPYITVRVNMDDYVNSMFNSLQTILGKNEQHLSGDQYTALIKHMMSDKDSLILNECEPHSSTFLFNVLRITSETVKRIAHV